MATLKETTSKVGTAAQKARNTKSTRLYFIGLIGAIVFVLWYFKIIKTGFAVGLGIILLAAFGIEAYDYDLDLGKLWETGNIQESRVESFKDDQGESIRLITGNCNAREYDLNCNDFSTQEAAQAKYNQCADEISKNNPGIDVVKLDIYRLDGNKNGIVCESLASNAALVP